MRASAPRLRLENEMGSTLTEKCEQVAERVWYDADDFPRTPSELRALLAEAARQGYKMNPLN